MSKKSILEIKGPANRELGSRPVRRAIKRLAEKTAAYNVIMSINQGKAGAHIPNKPGALKCW
jgi:hypothetical protein